MPADMPSILDRTAGVLCQALQNLLPPLSPQWWEACVKGKLSFQQRQHLERRGIQRLDQLDLAALVRIVDQNWYELADSHKWPYDGRNFVKEMQTVRNRWAHAQVSAPPQGGCLPRPRYTPPISLHGMSGRRTHQDRSTGEGRPS